MMEVVKKVPDFHSEYTETFSSGENEESKKKKCETWNLKSSKTHLLKYCFWQKYHTSRFAFISRDQKSQSTLHLTQKYSNFALDAPRRFNVGCFEKGCWTKLKGECLGRLTALQKREGSERRGIPWSAMTHTITSKLLIKSWNRVTLNQSDHRVNRSILCKSSLQTPCHSLSPCLSHTHTHWLSLYSPLFHTHKLFPSLSLTLYLYPLYPLLADQFSQLHWFEK